MRSNQNAFTLVELIIVVIILGILATIAINQIIRIKERAAVSTIKEDLSMAYKAAVAYELEYPGTDIAPDLDDLSNYGYRKSEGVDIVIVNWPIDELEITATHPSVIGIYRVDHTGEISKK